MDHESVCVCVYAGSEWDYVLLSTVRSLPQREIDTHPSDRWRAQNLGFITDQHQINVALTRARCGLIIIGTLSCCFLLDSDWQCVR